MIRLEHRSTGGVYEWPTYQAVCGLQAAIHKEPQLSHLSYFSGGKPIKRKLIVATSSNADDKNDECTSQLEKCNLLGWNLLDWNL